jgi:hypothetical protein
MQALKTILFWRRTDVQGLERLELSVDADGVRAHGVVLVLEDGGCRLEHRWRLSPEWRAQTVEVDRWDAAGHQRRLLERVGEGWAVDGAPRPDLHGAQEPDLSVTPFCNTFPMRRTPMSDGAVLTLDTCFIDAAAMTVERSRQSYVRLGQRRLRYVDLGLSAGFEAELEVDEEALVLRYEHLFERVAPD